MESGTGEQPILLFDSGVGGLSVLREMRRLLPDACYVYAADNGGYPYGIKSETELAARIPALLGRLTERYNPCVVVIACNTASTIALSHIRAALNVQVIGTVPAIKPAAHSSRSRVIGVLGTKATVRQPYVDQLIANYAMDCTVLRYGSARLVELAESKMRGDQAVQNAVANEIALLFEQQNGKNIDRLVLSCTHFPLLADEIAAAVGPDVVLVDSGNGIARRTVHLVAGRRWSNPASGTAVFTRRDTNAVGPMRPALARLGLETVEWL